MKYWKIYWKPSYTCINFFVLPANRTLYFIRLSLLWIYKITGSSISTCNRNKPIFTGLWSKSNKASKWLICKYILYLPKLCISLSRSAALSPSILLFLINAIYICSKIWAVNCASVDLLNAKPELCSYQ